MNIRLIVLFLLIIPVGATSDTNNTNITGKEDNLTFFMSDKEQDSIFSRFEEGKFQEFNQDEIIPYQNYISQNIAIGLASRGEYIKAIDILRLVPPDVRSRELIMLLAFMYCRTGDYDSAATYLTDLRVQYPDDPELDNAMAYILSISGNTKVARQIQGRIIKQVPDHAPALDTWGTILTAEGNFQNAEAFLEKAYLSLPDDPEVLSHLAEVYAHLGRKGDAQDLYQHAIKTGPAYGPAQKGYARVLMDLGRFQEAITVIRTAIRLMPGDPELITWEREVDAILLSWHIKHEQEAGRPLLIKHTVPANYSKNQTLLAVMSSD